MDLVSIRIKGMVVTNRYGSLSDGDILRTDAQFAAHLVDDLSCAEYLPAAPEPEPVAAPKPRAKSKTA